MLSPEGQKALVAWLKSGTLNIFGLPFAGKDTQARRLAEFFDGTPLGGGEILRSSQKAHVTAHLKTGILTPTEEYLEIVLPFLRQDTFAGKPLILSSVGRWHGEEPGVLQATEQSGHPTKAVIFLNLDEEHIYSRFHDEEARKHRGAREDDDWQVLQIRLKEFRNKTQPVINFYKKKGLLIEVNGNQSPKKVTAEILTKLYGFSQQ